MTRSSRTRVMLWVVLLVLAGLLTAGCGRLNRSATINQVTLIPGAATATALKQQLAKHGLANARVICAKTMIVNIGTRTSCSLTNAGTNDIVRFTYTTKHGSIDPGSVSSSS